MALTIPIPEIINPFTIIANARTARENLTQAITDQADAIAAFGTPITETEK